MTNEFIAYSPNITIKEAIEGFRKDAEEIETVYYIYVVDENEKLIGATSLRELLLAKPDAQLSEIMETKLKTVTPEADEMVVAEIISKYNLVALPVVDSEGILLGIVTIDDIIDRILPPAAKKKEEKGVTLWKKILLFLAVMGPGIITANIDNDASGITTYSVAGARFGYSLLWTLIPTTIALVVIQEMVARMGVITGKGLADLIRENYGVKTTFYMMLGLLIANFGTTVANFAGWAASMEILGISKYIMVPIGAISIWMLVTKGSYRFIERILLIACLIYFGYAVSGIMANQSGDTVIKTHLSLR